MNVLNIESFNGLSGDMIIGALIDLLDDSGFLNSLPSILKINASIKNYQVIKCGITANKIDIEGNETKYRYLKNLVEIVESSNLPREVKKKSLSTFQLLAKAESKIHNIPLNDVHFHEVGAIDTIIDVVGAHLIFEKLKIKKVICSPICTGKGFVKCQHGTLPVPAPATLELLKDFPHYPGEIESELSTPTGVAILKTWNPLFLNKTFITQKIGYGAGNKDFDIPNVLRMSLGKEETTNKNLKSDDVWILEANIDDSPGEFLGNNFQNILLDSGAMDFTLIPTLMKKSRPGHILQVLSPKNKIETLIDIILLQTTTIGVRFYNAKRYFLDRHSETIETPLGEIQYKCVTLPDGKIKKIPEYDSCQILAKNNEISLREAYFKAISFGL